MSILSKAVKKGDVSIIKTELEAEARGHEADSKARLPRACAPCIARAVSFR